MLSIHNIAWTISLMGRIREAISAGTLDPLRREILEVWG